MVTYRKSYLLKLLGEIRSFQGKHKLRQFKSKAGPQKRVKEGRCVCMCMHVCVLHGMCMWYKHLSLQINKHMCTHKDKWFHSGGGKDPQLPICEGLHWTTFSVGRTVLCPHWSGYAFWLRTCLACT